MPIPKTFKEKYKDLDSEALLEKLYDTEQSIVKQKKENKQLEKQLDKTEKEDFLKGKDLTDEQKEIFEKKLEAGYEKEDALNLATLSENKSKTAATEFNEKNSLPGNTPTSNTTMTAEEYNKMATDALSGKQDQMNKFAKIDEQVRAGEINVIE